MRWVGVLVHELFLMQCNSDTFPFAHLHSKTYMTFPPPFPILCPLPTCSLQSNTLSWIRSIIRFIVISIGIYLFFFFCLFFFNQIFVLISGTGPTYNIKLESLTPKASIEDLVFSSLDPLGLTSGFHCCPSAFYPWLFENWLSQIVPFHP